MSQQQILIVLGPLFPSNTGEAARTPIMTIAHSLPINSENPLQFYEITVTNMLVRLRSQMTPTTLSRQEQNQGLPSQITSSQPSFQHCSIY